MKSRYPRYLSHSLLGGVLVISLAGCVTNPSRQPADGVSAGNASAWGALVPAAQLEQQAAQQYAALKKDVAKKDKLLPANHAQVKRLRRISKKIIPQVTRWNQSAANWQWEVNLIDAPEVNAFCMPGGKIAFFTGILEKLNLTDDEVAMVMGHEIAHALREHARKQAGQGTAMNIGMAITSQVLELGQTTQQLMGTGAKLTMLKFSRDDENDADLVGMDIAARAGYDPRASITLWQKMMKAGGGAPPEWLSTHPSGSKRISKLQKHLPEAMPLYEKAKKSR